MKSAPFVVVATLFLSSNLHSSSAFKHCPTDRGYRWVGSYCLRFVKNKVSWYSASDVCKKEGGHLLRLENLSKMTYLIDWMNNNKLWDWYWVDGKDNHDYNFRWSSNGGQVGSNLWAALEPNHAFGSGQFCAHFYTWVKQGLGDSGCTYYNLPYICENESENGEWGYWGSWSSCSLSCGSGRQSRYRFCDNPKPKGLGATCPGSSHGTQTCNTQPCPVDGAWAAWAGWTLCSKTCGGGTMIRSRTCTNPKPNYGGKDCAQGNATQTIQCNENDCPIDGAWADWASWTTCTRTCGGGTMMRTRTCTNPKPQHGGKDCIRGNATQTMECNKNDCPIDGSWADWEDWSQCTMTCGGGTMMRTRTCTNPRPQHGGKDCLKGNATQTMECNKNDCPIDGAWADWAGWNPCTRTCGGGTMMRSRTCTNPKPQHGGKDCIRGNATQVTQCNLRDCPTCLLHDVPGTSRSVPGLRLKENESVRYYCLPEYKLVGGNEVRTCQGNGSLSNEEPKCTKCCGKARYIPNGFPDVPSGLCFGDSVTYQCESGYKPSNDTPITCMSPYAWPYLELPKCEADGNCNSSAIAGPAGGYKACSGSDMDKVCYMHCSNGKTYTSEQNLFECGAKTGWEWKVPMRGGNNHLRGTVGACEVSDDPAGLLMFLEGCDLTLQTSELTEALKEEIRNEMMKELAALNLCSDPCQIRDIEIETIEANGYRRAVLQEKLLRMKITLYAAPLKGSVTTQQSARIELSKAMKLLNTKAAALKQAILSQAITLHINGTPAKVGGTNLWISRPSLACPSGSIRKAFECFNCPVGTYHNEAEKKCSSCQFGQYQDERGQMSCKLCPNGTTTVRIGVTNSSQCREYEGCNCGIHPCTLNGTAFKCDCLPGYEDTNGTCTDIDECLTDVCPPNSRCINKEGSYRCECLPGYKGRSCIDIDECKNPSTCSNPRTQCANTVGSYDCICRRGFYGDNCERNCPVGFVQGDSSCYLITEKTMTFDDGRLMCERAYNGSHLADVKDKGTFKFVTKILQASGSYWTGLNDRSQEGKFVYSDGSQMSAYSEWGNGNAQPQSNDPTKNCVIIDGSAAFMWSVVDCNEKHLALCALERG